jgi:RNA polymerase sigma-70 factor (ECF subfamily)
LINQDRSLWDRGLVAEGLNFLEMFASGTDISEYHIEAAIASHHARAKHWQDTDWEAIVSLYDALMLIRPSPIVALNRAIAVGQHRGPEQGIIEVLAIRDLERLGGYPFYFATLGEFELRCGRVDAARTHFRAALDLARNPMERRFLEQRIAAP